MRVLVTGCAGFIGSHVTERLLAAGHAVIGLDCLTHNAARPDKLHNVRRAADWDEFEFALLDLAEADLSGPARRADAVIHLAGEPGVHASWGRAFPAYLRNNVLATQRLLEAIGHGVRIVVASSSSVYGDAGTPVSPYGATKLAAEQVAAGYAAVHGHDVIVLRYFTVYGPRQRPDMAFARACRAAVEGGAIELYGDGRQTRDFTFVGDVVDATLLALDAPAGTYDVGGGSPTSLLDAIGVIEREAGRPVAIRHAPARLGDVRDTRADPAHAVPGFRASTTLEAGLAAQARASLALNSCAVGARDYVADRGQARGAIVRSPASRAAALWRSS